MKLSRSLVVLLAFAAYAASRSSRPIPEKQIDLDSPPRQRWQPVLREILSEYGFNYTFGPVIAYLESMGEDTWALVEFIATELDKHVSSEYAEEMQGCADVASSMGYGNELPLSTIVGINLFYEFTTSCTSTVCVDRSNRIWHARNLDWSFGNASVQNLTIVADFQRGGATVYKTITWAGYIGAMTGMRPGGFSVTVDERSSGVLSVLLSLERMMFQRAPSVGFFMRDVLAMNSSYADALNTLTNASLASTVYFIVGGVSGNEGAVVTRKEFSADVWSIPNGPEPWFVLETNYDHDTNPPSDDDRRDLALDAMRKMGQAGIGASSLMGVLETPAANHSRGVFNSETVYSVIMSAGQNHFESYSWGSN